MKSSSGEVGMGLHRILFERVRTPFISYKLDIDAVIGPDTMRRSGSVVESLLIPTQGGNDMVVEPGSESMFAGLLFSVCLDEVAGDVTIG
jgi:hypothetical protein